VVIPIKSEKPWCIFVDGEEYLTVESDNAAYLNRWNEQVKLNSNWVDNANPKFGSLVCDSLSGIN